MESLRSILRRFLDWQIDEVILFCISLRILLHPDNVAIEVSYMKMHCEPKLCSHLLFFRPVFVLGLAIPIRVIVTES